MRKHHTQMTSEEYRALLTAVRSRAYECSPHAFDRMTTKRVSASQVSAMITYCSIIEAHNNVATEIRVLVRGKVAGDYVCAVVSLTTNTLVTVYWNKAGDYHATLDKSVYTWRANLIDVLNDYK